jgi:hypothetical protein
LDPQAVTVTLRAETSSGSMHLHVEVAFGATDLDDALRLIREAVGDAAPIFQDPDSVEVRQTRRDRHAV